MTASNQDYNLVKHERDVARENVKALTRVLRRMMKHLYRDHEMKLYDDVKDAEELLRIIKACDKQRKSI